MTEELVEKGWGKGMKWRDITTGIDMTGYDRM
jgi:hypothetical protein